jgi:DNA-directed RNA polymerase specialized sigma24 family protein
LLDRAHDVNDQLAKILNTSPSDIVNRRKRLIRILGDPPARGETVKGWLDHLSQDYFKRELVQHEERIDLERALTKLSETERQIVWLRYANSFTTHEIAEMMGLTERTTRRYLRSAQEKLSARLGNTRSTGDRPDTGTASDLRVTARKSNADRAV